MEEPLAIFGLTRAEAKIYLTLLRLGPSLAGITSRKSGIHRRNVYDALERLIEKGLVSYIVSNNRKYFSASDPDRLKGLLREKEERAEKVLPELRVLFSSVKEKQETLFFRGKDGLKTVFGDQIKTGKEVLILGASPEAQEILKFYLHWYTKKRLEKRIKIRLLYGFKYRERRKIPLAEIRYIKGVYSPVATNVYGDNVAVILWKKERPLAILIRDKEIAQGYREYFELLWKRARG